MYTLLAFYVFFSYVGNTLIIGQKDQGTLYTILSAIMWISSPLTFPIGLYIKVLSK